MSSARPVPPQRQVTMPQGKKHKRPFGDVVGDSKRRQMTMSDFFRRPPTVEDADANDGIEELD